ncbi:MAG: MBL fold metallo-hydrolase [Elusimicrobiota bacterium]|nr:MBL fold metallo-hydrolase [Elusimicrobiota bacterium]
MRITTPAAKKNHMRMLLACLALVLFSASGLRAQLKVSFVNVGQGDAIYIEFPNGRNALIDGGPSGVLIDSFLKSKGVTKIDYLALTHPHSDHYRGLKKIFSDYQVNNYYDTKAENVDAIGDNNLRELAAAEPGCATHYPKPGDNLNWDSKVTIKVFNACWEPVQMHNNDETNNCSLVMRLYYNGNGILLTGDANSEIETEMLSHFKSGLQSNILKVGHHGSRTSTSDAFLARVRPDYAFISVGVNNNYGHPHMETLGRLRNAGAKIYLTTAGTQSFTIPAPGRDALGPVNLIVTEEPAATAEKPVEERFSPVNLAWDPSIPEDWSSAALSQLKDQAAR